MGLSFLRPDLSDRRRRLGPDRDGRRRDAAGVPVVAGLRAGLSFRGRRPLTIAAGAKQGLDRSIRPCGFFEIFRRPRSARSRCSDCADDVVRRRGSSLRNDLSAFSFPAFCRQSFITSCAETLIAPRPAGCLIIAACRRFPVWLSASGHQRPVSFPLLARSSGRSPRPAVLTSCPRGSPPTPSVAAWGADRRCEPRVGSAMPSSLFGLSIVRPLLGHSTWHLDYRKSS